MFRRIGKLAIKLRFVALAGALAVVFAGLAYGSGAPDDLVSGGFDDKGSDSFEVQERGVGAGDSGGNRG